MREFPPCDKCTGLCCTAQASWVCVTLNAEEREREPFKSVGRIDEQNPTQSILPFDAPGGCCHFLDRATRRCTIYAERPAACRLYDCRKEIWTSGFFRANPHMLLLIAEHEKAG
jgi:Fe-S-cluster containining protein